MTAWERADAPALLQLLAEDARLALRLADVRRFDGSDSLVLRYRVA